MNAGFSVDPGVLLAGVLLLVGVIATGAASRYRVPSLLLFLGLGALVADDGLALVRFDDAQLAQNIATLALVIILFEGGLGTEPAAFRDVGLQAGLLATIGVAATAGVVGLAAWGLMGLPGTTALIGDWVWFLTTQLGVGLVAGLVVGWFGRWLTDRVTGSSAAPLGVITLALAAISYGVAAAAGGSGFLAVYLTGAVIASSRRSVRRVMYFHEGLAATAQAVLFLLLGILVFPGDLVPELGLAIVVGATLVLVARPVAVATVLSIFAVPWRHMVVVSWGGLRGAVPVVLATVPFTAGHPDGALIFDVAFVVVVLSVALQAPTVGLLARRLGVLAAEQTTVRPEIIAVDALEADLVEITIPDGSRMQGVSLRSSAELPR